MITRAFRRIRRGPLGGAVEYALQFMGGLTHPALLRSGASRDEERLALPGDDLVPEPAWEATRGITIDAPLARVWPWIAQMGYGRGGWYGWNPLEREDTGVTRILPDFLHPKVGDILLDGPGCHDSKGAWVVRMLEPPTTLVLYTLRDPFTGKELKPAASSRWYIETVWTFLLEEADPGVTRLLARTRVTIAPRWALAPMKVIGGGDTVMQNRLLEGIKVRAERTK